jgi:putative oxidoreductase
MFLQLSIRQMLDFDTIVPNFGGFWGLAPDVSVTILVIVELLCAVCIMLGFLTRIAVLCPLVLMLLVENVIMSSDKMLAAQLFNFHPGYPVMFIGIFIYMLLAGPGKISLDYIIAAHFTENATDENVLDKA